jgi:hypothetical protein
MKRILFIGLIIIHNLALHAQQGIGVINPDASSILEIASTKKGVLLPRMSTVQINAIVAPAVGLVVIDITENCVKLYDGSSWECQAKLSQEPWYDKASGNPATNNNQDLYTQGNVGIGNFGAKTKLEVTGNFRATGSGPVPTSGTGVEISYSSIPPIGNIGAIDRLTPAYKAMNMFGMNIRFTTGAGYAERMRVDSIGNVGINTISPQGKLEVNGEITASGTAGFNKANSTRLDYVGTQGRISVLGSNSTTKSGFRIDQYSSDASIGSVAFDINATGNIGIGTTSQTNLLHINGTNPIRLEGLQAGAATDSLLTVDNNGVVRKMNRDPLSTAPMSGSLNAMAIGTTVYSAGGNYDFSSHTMPVGIYYYSIYNCAGQLTYPSVQQGTSFGFVGGTATVEAGNGSFADFYLTPTSTCGIMHSGIIRVTTAGTVFFRLSSYLSSVMVKSGATAFSYRIVRIY